MTGVISDSEPQWLGVDLDEQFPHGWTRYGKSLVCRPGIPVAQKRPSGHPIRDVLWLTDQHKFFVTCGVWPEPDACSKAPRFDTPQEAIAYWELTQVT